MSEVVTMDKLDPALGADVLNWFSYHAPSARQRQLYERLRDGAKDYALELAICVPEGPERKLAIEKLREVVMWANAGIACAPPVADELATTKAEAPR